MRLGLILLITSFVTPHAAGQCVAPVQAPFVTCGTGTPLQDNITINNGDSYFAIGGNYSNITLSGGILVLCGTVTITDLNFNSGSLIVSPGASATFSGNFNVGGGPNIDFYNFGAATINVVNLNIQGNSNFIYNDVGATISLSGSIVIFNNGVLINNGNIQGMDATINNGNICLGPSSAISMRNVRNDAVNPVSVSGGSACFSYSGSFDGNNPITATGALTLCQQPGATAPAAAARGSAILVSNCTSCASLGPTPLKLQEFTGNFSNGKATLQWQTSWEYQVKKFIIESSKDGRNFIPASEVAANNQPSSYKYSSLISSDTYFRLRIVDLDGSYSYSPVLFLRIHQTINQITLLSNPVSGNFAELSIGVTKNQIGVLMLIDNLGRILKTMKIVLSTGTSTFRWDLTSLVPGAYQFVFAGQEKINPVQFVRF